jgi:hypothetical protein
VAIDFTCECGKEYRADDQYAGMETQCKRCGASVIIPQPGSMLSGTDFGNSGSSIHDAGVPDFSSHSGSSRKRRRPNQPSRRRSQTKQRSNRGRRASGSLSNLLWPSLSKAFSEGQRDDTQYPNARWVLSFLRWFDALLRRLATIYVCIGLPIVVIYAVGSAAEMGPYSVIILVLAPVVFVLVWLLAWLALIFFLAGLEVSRSVLDGADDLYLIRSHLENRDD